VSLAKKLLSESSNWLLVCFRIWEKAGKQNEKSVRKNFNRGWSRKKYFYGWPREGWST
jgi:hypothetical protein